MLEAVKPVLLEKVDIIWSQLTNSVSSFHSTQPCHSPCHTPRPLSTTVPISLHCLY